MQHSGYALSANSTGGTLDPILNAWDGTPHLLDNDYYIKLTDMVSCRFDCCGYLLLC